MGIPYDPVGAVICLHPDPIPEDKGSIITPDKYRVPPVTGVVVAAGPLVPSCYEAGMRVLYGKYAGTLAKLDEEIVLMIDASEVLSIVEADLPVAVAI
jgi:co-chaperonin GroES (HSP10)